MQFLCCIFGGKILSMLNMIEFFLKMLCLSVKRLVFEIGSCSSEPLFGFRTFQPSCGSCRGTVFASDEQICTSRTCVAQEMKSSACLLDHRSQATRGTERRAGATGKAEPHSLLCAVMQQRRGSGDLEVSGSTPESIRVIAASSPKSFK